MNTGHRPSTMLTSPFFRLTSQVATATPAIAPIAMRPLSRSNKTNIRRDLPSDRHAPVAGLHQQHLHVSDHALHETAFAVAEVILPHAYEFLAVPEAPHLHEVGAQVVPPVRQRGGIVRADVVEVEQPQIAGARDGRTQRGYRRNAAAREDVALDEIHRAPRAFITL